MANASTIIQGIVWPALLRHSGILSCTQQQADPEVNSLLLIGAGLLVLLIGLGVGLMFFRRRKPASTTPTRYSRSEQDAETAIVNDTWLSLLKEQLPFPDPEPYAEFHNKTLIVGIGDAGRAVLNMVADRVEDMNMQMHVHMPERSSEENRNCNLALLHVHIPLKSNVKRPETHPQINVLSVDTITQNDMHIVQRKESHTANWEWAVLTNHINDVEGVGRHSARVAVTRDCQNGPGMSQIYKSLLEFQSLNFNTIYLVGSAVEYVGANIIGDLAGLAHLTVPQGQLLNVHSIVLAQDQKINPILGPVLNEDDYLTCTLHEISRLTSPGAMRVAFGPHLIFTNAINQPVIKTGYVVTGQAEKGIQQAAYFLWGALTNQHFAQAIHKHAQTQDVKDENTSTISLLYTYALVQPLRLLRRILSIQLLDKVLNRREYQNLPHVSRIANEEQAVELVLAETREDGLFSQINTLRVSLKSTPYLNRIATILADMRGQTQQKNPLAEAKKSLNNFVAGKAYTVPIEPTHWERALCDDEDALEVLRRIGWVVQESPRERANGRFVLLAMASVQQNRYDMHYEPRESNAAAYAHHIKQFVNNAVENRHIIQQQTALRIDEERAYLRTEWNERYETWRKETLRQLEGGMENIQPFFFGFGTDIPQGNSMFATAGSDPAFALQGLMLPRIPLRILKLTSPQATTWLQHILWPAEAIVLDIFGTDGLVEVPFSLQHALTYREPFWLFYQCWRAGGREVFQAELKLIDRDTSWQDLVWEFISKYEKDSFFHSQVDSYVAEHSSTEGDIPGFLPDTAPEQARLFSTKLDVVFKAFANRDNLRTYPPDLREQSA